MIDQTKNRKSRNKKPNMMKTLNGLLKIQVLIFLISLLFFGLFDVCLAQDNITITNIWYKKMPDYTRVTIKADNPIDNYDSMYTEDPECIVVDFHQADYDIDELVKNVLFLNMGSVKQVRCGQIEEDKVRFTIDLFHKVDYDMALDNSGQLLQINVYDYDEFLTPEEQIYTVEPLSAEEIKKINEKKEERVPSLVEQVTEPITMNLKEAEVVDAITTLSMLSGVNIVADDSVTGNITLNIKGASFKETLDLITSLKRLSYTQVGNALVFGTPEIIDTYRERITRIVHLENADTENVKSVLDSYFGEDDSIKITADTRLNSLIVEGTPESITKAEGLIAEMDASLITEHIKLENIIQKADITEIKRLLGIFITDENRFDIDERQNEVIIRGNQEEISNAKTLIEGLDKRAPQIMIEAKIVEITLDGEKDMGIRWFSDGNEGTMTLGELTLGDSFERQGKIEARLEALESESKVNILSNPKVLTMDGKEAIIKSGQEIPIQEEVVDEDGNIRKTVTWKDVSVKLTITPRLTHDDLINMDVLAEVKSLGTEAILGYPIINDRSENALIRSKLGETNVIGGLISSEEIETIRRIPILSEIPFFGEIFKFRNKTKKRTEVIVLITANEIEY
jgi:type IV pilus assembly protein PilQ